MAFDWKKLEREDRERSDRSGVILMITYLSIGLIGTAAHLLTGFGSLESAVMYLVLGLLFLLIWRLVLRGRRKQESTDSADR